MSEEMIETTIVAAGTKLASSDSIRKRFLASQAAKQLAAYDKFVQSVADCKEASRAIARLEWPTSLGDHAAQVSKLMNKLQKGLLAGCFKTADTATLTGMSQGMESFMDYSKKAEQHSDATFALLCLLDDVGDDLTREVRDLCREAKVTG